MTAEEALTGAYTAHRGLAVMIAGGVEDGEDLLQDAYMRLWLVRDRYAPEDMARMFVPTMRNIARDWYRRTRCVRFEHMPEHWIGAVDHDSPERLVIRAEERLQVRTLVLALGDVQRAVVIGHYWHGDPLRTPVAKCRALRGRKVMRAALEGVA